MPKSNTAIIIVTAPWERFRTEWEFVLPKIIDIRDIGLIRIPSRVPVSRSLARATPRAVHPEAITFNAIKPGAT